MVSAPPLQWRDLNWNFTKILWGQKFFLHLRGDKPLSGELKLYGRSNIYYYTFIYTFFPLEIASTQKSEVLLLRISSRNVNGSGVVICPYPQIY